MVPQALFLSELMLLVYLLSKTLFLLMLLAYHVCIALSLSLALDRGGGESVGYLKAYQSRYYQFIFFQNVSLGCSCFLQSACVTQGHVATLPPSSCLCLCPVCYRLLLDCLFNFYRQTYIRTFHVSAFIDLVPYGTSKFYLFPSFPPSLRQGRRSGVRCMQRGSG